MNGYRAHMLELGSHRCQAVQKSLLLVRQIQHPPTCRQALPRAGCHSFSRWQPVLKSRQPALNAPELFRYFAFIPATDFITQRLARNSGLHQQEAFAARLALQEESGNAQLLTDFLESGQSRAFASQQSSTVFGARDLAYSPRFRVSFPENPQYQ